MPTIHKYITPDQVYTMALKGEKDALKAAVVKGYVNIDELYMPTPGMLFPPIVFLAMQKQDLAVDILLECDAHIRHAVFGAAFAGNQLALNRYLQIPGGTKQRAAEGAALGGQFELLRKIESEIWEQLDKSRIAYYLASRGDEMTLQRYLDAGASIQNAVNGAAIAGKFDLLKTLQSKGKTDNEHTLCFLAQGGHQQQVFSSIEDDVDPNFAAYGAAVAGRIDLLHAIMQRFPKLDQSGIIYHLGFGGHQTAVFDHLHETKTYIQSAASGAIPNRHLTLLMQLDRMGELDEKLVIEELKKAGHADFAHQYAQYTRTESDKPQAIGPRFLGNPRPAPTATIDGAPSWDQYAFRR